MRESPCLLIFGTTSKSRRKCCCVGRSTKPATHTHGAGTEWLRWAGLKQKRPLPNRSSGGHHIRRKP